jgi:ABC-2 type transport system permease protein
MRGGAKMASVRRIMADLRFYGRGYLRNTAGLFFGLIFPVILILIFGAIFANGFSGTVTVYIQNKDNGPVSLKFISAINATGTVSLVQVDPSENFSQYLSTHSASDGIIIPPNFSTSYENATRVNVTVYGNPAESSSAIVSGTVSEVINAFNLNRYGGQPIIGIDSTTVNSQATKYIDFLIPGLIGFSILVSPMFSLVNVSSEYKKTKLFKELSLTPITKMEWLAAKVLWYILLSATSFLLMVAAGVLVFGAHIVLTVWLIPFLILGPMLFASMGMLVGTLAKTSDTASVIGNVITFPMMFLSGTFFPISLMPMYLRTIAHILPLYYVIEGLNAVMIYSNYAQVATDLLVVTVITAIMFVAAARVFKWRED